MEQKRDSRTEAGGTLIFGSHGDEDKKAKEIMTSQLDKYCRELARVASRKPKEESLSGRNPL